LEDSKSGFAPWISCTNQSIIEKADSFKKLGLNDKAKLDRNAFYHNEVIEFAKWI
jgi:hypothetical protein